MQAADTAQTVSLHVADELATITLTRPERNNVIDAQFGQEFRDIAIALMGDAGVRAILLRGEGANFCVGGDIRSFAREADLPVALRRMTLDFHAAMAILARLDTPIVCAVQGAAAGAGLALAALSDYVIAEDTATFSFAYTKLGLTGDGGITWLLPRLIGLRRFQALVLEGRSVDAAEALAMGLVSRIAGADGAGVEAQAFARELAAGPTRAYGMVRRLAQSSFTQPFERQLEDEAQAICRAAASADAQDAITAFAARRKPVFKGR